MMLQTNPLAHELNLCVFEEAIKAGAHITTFNQMPGAGEIFFRHESGLHWDMLCNMDESEVTVDGDLFYKDGKIVVEE